MGQRQGRAGDDGGTATPANPAAPQSSITFKAVCRSCQRTVRRHSRRALTWKCPHEGCGAVNVGPGLLEELARPPAAGAGSRRARRERDAAAAAAAGAGATTPAAGPSGPAAPAPVRRKPRAAAPAPAAAAESLGGTRPASAGRASGAPPQPRGLFDRLLYGSD